MNASNTSYLLLRTDSKESRLVLQNGHCWTLGRSKENSIILPDRSVSRKHALLQCVKTGEFYILDRGSRNGSFVNGQRINLPAMLNDGDRLALGNVELEFHKTSAHGPAVTDPLDATIAKVATNPSPQRTVLMLMASKQQGEIWQTALASQQILVLWESSSANLAQVLKNHQAAGLPLPNLLLMDFGGHMSSPYAFCRWCRDNYPDLKVVLTSGLPTEVSASERRWATHQGAQDLLSGFQADNLLQGINGAVSNVKRVLDVLECPPLQAENLLPLLVALNRFLGRQEKGTLGDAPLSSALIQQLLQATSFVEGPQTTSTIFFKPQRRVAQPDA